jgi:peptide/nickel transport system permease protein
MLFGEINNFRSIPIKNYKFDSHDIVFTVLNPNGSGGEEVHRVSVADILYPLNVNTKINNDFKKNILRFYDFESVTPISKSLKELQEKIIENNLIVKTYLLGTDPVGRDLLSRLMIGTRISFSVGLVAVFISVVIGVFLGAIAGYFRGFADEFIMWIINVVWSVPVLLLVIAISLALGKGFWQMFVAVGLTMWVEVARIVRGQLMSMREKEFVDAGRALGFSKSRIIFKHILPNVLSSVIIISAANFAGAILIEAGLSFLGIGAQAPVPSWGAMISSHRGYIIGSMPYLAFIPGLAIMSMVLAFVLIGNGLRDAMDTKFVDDENLIV